MLILVNNVHEKTFLNFESVRALFVTILHSCYNFALELYENALVFSQSEARNFFI